MEYQITYKQIGKSNPTKVALTIKNDEKMVYVDQLDLSKKDKLEKYINELFKKYN